MPGHKIENADERVWVHFIAMASQFSAVSPSLSSPRSPSLRPSLGLLRRFFMQQRFLTEVFLFGLLRTYIYTLSSIDNGSDNSKGT